MYRTYSKTLSYNTSAILHLPCVNHDPSKQSTVYLCLLHTAEEGEKIGQSITMVILDQPLYAKVCEMVLDVNTSTLLSRMTIRLGGFHLM